MRASSCRSTPSGHIVSAPFPFHRPSIPPPTAARSIITRIHASILRPYLTAFLLLPPSTPLKTAQNRPFCKRIQPPRLSIAADRAPEDLLKIPVCKFSCKFMARKNGSRTHRPAPVAYSALSSSPLSPLSRSTSSAFLSASGTGTPSRPQFSTILRPSLAT